MKNTTSIELGEEIKQRVSDVLQRNFGEIKMGKLPFADPNLPILADLHAKATRSLKRRGCLLRTVMELLGDRVDLFYDPTRTNPWITWKSTS